MRTRLCENCTEVYRGRVSCPECDHIPRTDRADYDPPDPCRPWRAELSFDDAHVSMTVSNADQRRFIHELIRLKGGGRR